MIIVQKYKNNTFSKNVETFDEMYNNLKNKLMLIDKYSESKLVKLLIKKACSGLYVDDIILYLLKFIGNERHDIEVFLSSIIKDNSVLYNNYFNSIREYLLNDLVIYKAMNNDIVFRNLEEAEAVPEASIFVTSMNNLFESKYKNNYYMSVDFSKFDTRNVVNMQNMFEGCKYKSIDISSFDLCNVKNMFGTFANIEVQEDIILGSLDFSNVKTIKFMFGSCKANRIDLSKTIGLNKVRYNNLLFHRANINELIIKKEDYEYISKFDGTFIDCNSNIILV